MKIPRESKIEMAVSGDEMRPALMHLNLRKDGFLEATDGRIIARIKAGEDGDVPGLVPVAAITYARSLEGFGEICIECRQGVVVTSDGTAFVRPEYHFPITDPIDQMLRSDDKYTTAVTLNARLLSRLLMAVGGDAAVSIRVSAADEPVKLQAAFSEHAFAVIMPVRMNKP